MGGASESKGNYIRRCPPIFYRMPIPLTVAGQGVFLFDHVKGTPCSLTFKNPNATASIDITFMKGRMRVTAGLDPLDDPDNKSGLSDLSGAYYWFSVDAQNQMLYGGVGEPRMETVVYKYKMDASQKQYLEKLTLIDYGPGTLVPRKVLKDPVPKKLPLKVKNMHQLTMHHIATGSYMPVANLAQVSQKMYKCIAGNQFVLDDASFPQFSRAIQKSIVTPGSWCYETLLKKANEFGKPNPDETYLRITLGMNGGESPGIPYVMEIWPVGHYSPIHNHGGSEAIIRVLLGSIHVSLYPYLCGEPTGIPPFKEVSFSQGDITWISPTLNQTHQLKNLKQNTSTCITIQCYMYDEKNKAHYDYFDYIDDAGNKLQYEPDSDMEFLEFKEVIRREWNGRRRWWFC